MSVLLVFGRYHCGLEMVYRGSISFEHCLWTSQLLLAHEISLWTFFPPLSKLTIHPADGEPGSALKKSVLTALSIMQKSKARQPELCSCPLKENVAHPGLVWRTWIP